MGGLTDHHHTTSHHTGTFINLDDHSTSWQATTRRSRPFWETRRQVREWLNGVDLIGGNGWNILICMHIHSHSHSLYRNHFLDALRKCLGDLQTDSPLHAPAALQRRVSTRWGERERKRMMTGLGCLTFSTYTYYRPLPSRDMKLNLSCHLMMLRASFW